jgi:hypothetical protein
MIHGSGRSFLPRTRCTKFSASAAVTMPVKRRADPLVPCMSGSRKGGEDLDEGMTGSIEEESRNGSPGRAPARSWSPAGDHRTFQPRRFRRIPGGAFHPQTLQVRLCSVFGAFPVPCRHFPWIRAWHVACPSGVSARSRSWTGRASKQARTTSSIPASGDLSGRFTEPHGEPLSGPVLQMREAYDDQHIR